MESPFASWMEKANILDPSFQEFLDPEDEMLKLLQKKGYEHEADYLEVSKKLDAKFTKSIHQTLKR